MATLQTGGFRGSVMPRLALADPRQFAYDPSILESLLSPSKVKLALAQLGNQAFDQGTLREAGPSRRELALATALSAAQDFPALREAKQAATAHSTASSKLGTLNSGRELDAITANAGMLSEKEDFDAKNALLAAEATNADLTQAAFLRPTNEVALAESRAAADRKVRLEEGNIANRSALSDAASARAELSRAKAAYDRRRMADGIRTKSPSVHWTKNEDFAGTTLSSVASFYDDEDEVYVTQEFDASGKAIGLPERTSTRPKGKPTTADEALGGDSAPASASLGDDLLGSLDAPVAPSPPGARATVNQASIDYLRRHPNTAAQFDLKFGPGTAAKVLSQP